MSSRDPGRDVNPPRARKRARERHGPTFRDRPGEAILSVLVVALIGAAVAYGCTALLVD